MRAKTGVLLLNLGTPDSPKTSDVRKYLREFLMDARVIDINYVSRWFLINLIIAPFRGPKSAHEYKKLWTENGSPLKVNGYAVAEALQASLGDHYKVVLGMRYQQPSIEHALLQLEGKGFERIVVLPMYPQYASASTGSTFEAVVEKMKNWHVVPDVHFISRFQADAGFINAFTAIGKEYLDKGNYDHVMFSYHGLPERQILKGSVNDYCQLGKCCDVSSPNNTHCYRGNCFHTTRELVKNLDIKEGDYTVCFQSRLGSDPWIKPYTDEKIKELAAAGKKRVLAFSPAFVSDCLETTVEVGETYRDDFKALGGEEWTLVESLNTHPLWVEALKNMVVKYQ